jgi:hypothetical protein
MLPRAAHPLVRRVALEPRPARQRSSSQASADAATASLRRHVLPKDLPAAVKQLDDQELERLLAAALAEQKRRGKKPAASSHDPVELRTEVVAVHLTPGKLNAVQSWHQAIADRLVVRLGPVRGVEASAGRRSPFTGHTVAVGFSADAVPGACRLTTLPPNDLLQIAQSPFRDALRVFRVGELHADVYFFGVLAKNIRRLIRPTLSTGASLHARSGSEVA